MQYILPWINVCSHSSTPWAPVHSNLFQLSSMICSLVSRTQDEVSWNWLGGLNIRLFREHLLSVNEIVLIFLISGSGYVHIVGIKYTRAMGKRWLRLMERQVLCKDTYVYVGFGSVIKTNEDCLFCQTFTFLNAKCESSFLMKRNPRKVTWTVLYR